MSIDENSSPGNQKMELSKAEIEGASPALPGGQRLVPTDRTLVFRPTLGSLHRRSVRIIQPVPDCHSTLRSGSLPGGSRVYALQHDINKNGSAPPSYRMLPTSRGSAASDNRKKLDSNRARGRERRTPSRFERQMRTVPPIASPAQAARRRLPTRTPLKAPSPLTKTLTRAAGQKHASRQARHHT